MHTPQMHCFQLSSRSAVNQLPVPSSQPRHISTARLETYCYDINSARLRHITTYKLLETLNVRLEGFKNHTVTIGTRMLK